MEQLFTIFSQAAERCGVTVLILTALAAVLFCVQIYCWIARYGRIPAHRGAAATDGDAKPAVSVAMVCRGNDCDFLERRLGALLEQEYEHFEIVVADLSGDADFDAALMRIAEKNPRLRVVHLVRDRRFPISDKMALNMAIKAAAFDNIILTTPDTTPDSPHWLARMARGFNAGEVVLGYCGMAAAHTAADNTESPADAKPARESFAEKMIRIDNVCHSVRWLSAAVHRHPYRGTIQNIGFTKKLYFDNGGFNHLDMNIGIDDLFIQKIIGTKESGVRVATVVSASSTVRQKIWGGLRWWYVLRRTRSFSRRHYPLRLKISTCAELASRLLFFGTAATLIVCAPAEFKLCAAAALLLRLAVVMFEMHRIAKRLGERGLWFAALVCDLLAPLCELTMAADRLFRHSPSLWR